MNFDAIAIPLPDSASLRMHTPPPLPRVRVARSQGRANEMSVLRDKRRDSARTRLHMAVNLTRASDLSSRTLWAYDIGLGGMQCRCKDVMFPGTYLDLAFRLPGTRELLKVGAQVASLGESPEGGVTLRVRFCRLSARTQLSIYRFLDKRRDRWSSQEQIGEAPRLFEALLTDAYSALQAEELRELGFVCTPWPQGLMPQAEALTKPQDVKPVVLQ
ncbi:MAG: hypothetical protein H7Z43_13190 [Clostridia bacterium]|nr:hypothetical protein [Deltaproteobacteria bacterium]